MPTIADLLTRRAGIMLETAQDATSLNHRELLESFQFVEKRIYIPCCNSSSPPGLVEAETVDPWQESGKYALGWVYFSVILLVATAAVRWYHFFNDKIRVARSKAHAQQRTQTPWPKISGGGHGLSTDKSTAKFFPRETTPPLAENRKEDMCAFSSWLINCTLAAIRYVFYHPIPNLSLRKRWRPIVFPSLGVVLVVLAALVFTILYCFLPQPLYRQSIAFGSPPLAVRAGMMAVALMPWIVGLSMKANFISIITGMGHERLNVLHRWLAYLCLLLGLIHTIPYYVTPVWDENGLLVFTSLLKSLQSGTYIYGTGIAALVPLCFLCLHSIPPLRTRFYELFVIVHAPVAIILLGVLFWHCHNYLTSWHYLWATTVIWLASYVLRLFYLNWTNISRMSWIVGDEAAVTVLPENAVKVTIPTQVRWKPGQYVYLRMPGISIFENHPFTIASLCNDDYPSQYGQDYRDMVVVFRPFGGFTKRVLDSALDHGPWQTYRASIDGPYGGMRRTLESFDHVVLIAGGSGITAVVSNLLDLIKRMRDGKAVTKTVHLIWALKRPETMEWFKEELRICREFAPSDTVSCQFFITAANRQSASGKLVSAQTPNRPTSMVFHNKVNLMIQNIASNRFSVDFSKRGSAMVREEAEGDLEREKELRDEYLGTVEPLPQAHLKPHRMPPQGSSHDVARWTYVGGRGLNQTSIIQETPHMPPHPTLHEKRRSQNLTLDITNDTKTQTNATQAYLAPEPTQQFDFGFPSTPTEFQKGLMRFAFMPTAVKPQRRGWNIEWGRPDLPYMLNELSEEWTGRRACVFVCGPPSMRVDVSHSVAELQKLIFRKSGLDEVFLHTENYAL